MRRPAAVLAAGVVSAFALLGSAPVVAQDAVPQGWGSSTAAVDGTRLHGAMQRDGTYKPGLLDPQRPYTVTVRFTVARPPDLPAPCAVPEIPGPAPATTRVGFDVTPTFECNGAYPVAVTGSADGNGGTATLNRTIVVAMPAPAVTGVAVALDEGEVEITWDDMTAQAKDLTGYRVERLVDGGEPAVVAEPGPAPDGSIATSARDEDLPEQGQVLTYRVVAVRNVTGPGEIGETSHASITREGEVVDTPPSAGGGGEPAPGGGAPGGAGDGTGDASAGDGAGSGRAPRPQRVAPPRVGISGSFLPPLLQPILDTAAAARAAATADEGYDEDLPYNPVDGPAEAEAPDDELAAFFSGEAAGRGMAIPVATALVLAVWAFHFRVLARAAKPSA